MTAYVIVDINVTDPVRYEDYKRLAAPTVELYGGNIFARGGKTETLEGDWSPTRLVILQFDNTEQAKSWLNSTEYSEARACVMKRRTPIWWSSRAFDTIAPMFDLDPVLEDAKDKLIAIAFHDFETGAEYFLNADEAFHPASTFKVHVMMEVFRQAQEGLLSLEDCIPIINSFTSIADGSKYSLDVNDDAEQTLYPRIGEPETIRELTRLMIVRSSNLATNILLEKVGTKNVNDFIQELGIEGVVVRRGVEDNAAFRLGMNNSATARGLSQTMKLIAEGKVVSNASLRKNDRDPAGTGIQ